MNLLQEWKPHVQEFGFGGFEVAIVSDQPNHFLSPCRAWKKKIKEMIWFLNFGISHGRKFIFITCNNLLALWQLFLFVITSDSPITQLLFRFSLTKIRFIVWTYHYFLRIWILGDSRRRVTRSFRKITCCTTCRSSQLDLITLGAWSFYQSQVLVCKW